jgi:hypothetical protein
MRKYKCNVCDSLVDDIPDVQSNVLWFLSDSKSDQQNWHICMNCYCKLAKLVREFCKVAAG